MKKLYEKIENDIFCEIDKDRAIELIKYGNGHLVYNHLNFKLQQENQQLKDRINKAINDIDKLEKDIMSNTIIGFNQFIPSFNKIKNDLTENEVNE